MGGVSNMSYESIPSCDWSVDQVVSWLQSSGLGSCASHFKAASITGARLLNLDARDLKMLAENPEDRNKIKKKVRLHSVYELGNC